MKSIFCYTNFRKYLRDLQQEKYKTSRAYTQRGVSRMMSASPSLFAQILHKHILSSDCVKRVVEVFKLTGIEAQYFREMVEYCQNKDHRARRDALAQMHHIRGESRFKVPAEKYEFYEKWYYSAIWSAIGCEAFEGDFAHLARSLTPPIKVPEARKAVKLLLDLGLIEKRPNGSYSKKRRLLSTGDEVEDVALNTFFKQAMQLGIKAIDMPREERSLSTVTVGVSEKVFKDILAELQKTRNKIMGMAHNSRKADRVYQINIQVIPVAKCRRGKA